MPVQATIKHISFILFITYASTVAHAKNVIVFAEHRPIAMTNSEHPPKDIYINAGSNSGLKVGETLSIQRHQTVYNSYKNSAVVNLVFTVGKIRLIHVQPQLSVGRVVALANYKNTPAVDYDAIMIGDKVNLSSGTMSSDKTADVPHVKPAQLIGAVQTKIVKAKAPNKPVKQAEAKQPVSPTVAEAKATVPAAP